MKTFKQIEQDSKEYAEDRFCVEDMPRVDEVAMAWRDGYRTALGDLTQDAEEKSLLARRERGLSKSQS